MATSSRKSGSSLVPDLAPETEQMRQPDFSGIRRLLEEEPFRVQFFQAVRMLQRMEQDRQPVGHFITPRGETIRFCSLPTLSFPPSELYSLERMAGGQMRMTVQFMGMCSAISVLPSPYTELVLQRIREQDHSMSDFFDIFNHRMISFFYRGWEKYRFFIGYESAGSDHISPRLMDLIGLGTEGLPGRAGIPDQACLNYVGLLGRHVRSAASLQQILEDYFGVAVEVHQFAGTWRKLKPENQTSFSGLGRPSERLGVGVVAGDEVWDHHGRIRVVLGPMRFPQYLTFLPGQSAYAELCAWLRFYSHRVYETEVQLILDREDAPSCELGTTGPTAPRLGFVSWLKTKPMQQNPADAIYLVQ
jgi:type VI secretion system protein ImpH